MKEIMQEFHEDKIIRSSIMLLLLVCLVGIIWLSIQVTLLSQFIFANNNANDEVTEIKNLIDEMQVIYNQKYINDTDKERLTNSTLAGFAYGHGDRYGYYSSPRMATENENDRHERLVGIGVEIVYEENKGCYVIDTFEGSPAEESGIKTGDYIVGVDGESASDLSREEFINKILGESGTTVQIEVESNNKNKSIEIERTDVKNKSVTSQELTDNVAYLRIKSFTEYSDEEFIEELEKYKKQGYSKYIIDLRDNHGGVAETVISMIDYIVPEGLIAKFISKDESDNQIYNSNAQEFDGEIVILVNKTTASASELFTQVLRDYNKATIVGEKTFGKGTVISTYMLSNGGTITLSTAKYYTKSGYEIERNGIKPDKEVVLTEDEQKISYKIPLLEDRQVLAGLEELGEDIVG